jgi:hypothetical protein
MNNLSKKETIILFIFVLVFVFVFWKNPVLAGATFNIPCNGNVSPGTYECSSGAGGVCNYSICTTGLCPTLLPHASKVVKNCTTSKPACAGQCGVGGVPCDGTCPCTIAGNCTYTCDDGWMDSEGNDTNHNGCETPSGVFNFSLSDPSPIEFPVSEGDSTPTITVTATMTSAPAELITFDDPSLPSGVTIQWIKKTCTPNPTTCDGKFILNAGSVSADGVYLINISAKSDGGLIRSTPQPFRLVFEHFDFTISSKAPTESGQIAYQGETTPANTYYLTLKSGRTKYIGIIGIMQTEVDPPSGVGISLLFSLSGCTPPAKNESCSIDLSIAATIDAPIHAFYFSVEATGGNPGYEVTKDCWFGCGPWQGYVYPLWDDTMSPTSGRLPYGVGG